MTLGAVSGRRIDSVFVVTAPPVVTGALSGWADRLHARTRPEVLRRELLFAAGDTVDTLRIAESLRRLRALPYLQSSRIEAQDCRPTLPAVPGAVASTALPPIQLIVDTRDTWSTHPEVRLSRPTPVLGLTEHNLLGTGRTIGVGLVSNAGHLGAATTVADPFGFGTGISTRAAYQRYVDGSASTLTVGRHQVSLADRWRTEVDLLDLRREPRSALGDHFERTAISVLGGVRLSPPQADHVIHFLGGMFGEQVALSAAPTATIIGPATVYRRLVAPIVGLSLTPARFDTLTWLLPDHALVDVPRTIAGEFVVGVGPGTESQSNVAGQPALALPGVGQHLAMTYADGWLGREWRPSDHSRIVTDLWGSGFRDRGTWQSSTMRGAMTADQGAPNGLWEVTVAGEQLTDPDPDVRALTMFDRLLHYLPPRSQLSETACAMSVERTRHLRRLNSAVVLDGGLFAATTWHWEPAAPVTAAVNRADPLAVSALGVSLSLLPSRQGQSLIRVDFGVPLGATAGVSRKPRLVLMVVPWLESLRHRGAQTLQ